MVRPEWSGLVDGVIGNWRLDSLVRAGSDTADYAGTSGGLRTWVRVALAGSEAGHNLTRVSELGLASEHLLKVYETGAGALDGVRLVYLAVEMPDDDIGEILANRKLDADEARAMTAAAAGALFYLHDRGLKHGAVIPGNMFIAGDAVKLGVESIAAADSRSGTADLKQLGTAIVDALTKAGSRDPSLLPVPFRAVARGCLDAERSGWTAARVLDVLNGRAEAVAPLPVDAPVTAVGRPRAPMPRVAIAAGAVVAAVLALVAYRSTRESTAAPQAEQRVAVVKETPAFEKPSPARSAEKTKPGRKVAPVPAAVPGQTTDRARTRTETGGSWAVIAATYNSFPAAQGRAGRLAAQAPGLRPEVYPPEGSGKRYYVVLGSGMSREEAERLLETARQKGAPRDVYVTKLNRN